MSDLQTLQRDALAAVAAAGTVDDLDEARVRFTGKRSDLVGIQQRMRDLTPEGRKELGQQLNAFRAAFQSAFDARHAELASAAMRDRLEGERLDLTLPPRRLPPGRPHLLTQVEQEIVDVFVGLGYRVADGPEVESGAYNFDLLNTPPDHPARQEQDTIYVAGADDVVLRTQTSAVQARSMTTQPPPVAVVCPGRVYRADSVDATHSPVFTQVEGLLVAEGVSMTDLRGTLLAFSRALFGEDREIRLRPSFFPFTEPSAEVDVACGFCDPGSVGIGGGAGDPGSVGIGGGAGAAECRVCSGTGWIEILGAGMVDPNVLTACGYDPTAVTGFAFGIGVERVAMLRHNVRDIRDLYDADARFLANF